MNAPAAETLVLGEEDGQPLWMVYQDSHTPAPAPVLLLLHGLFDQRGTWDLIWPHLAGSHRLIAPDLVGFGASSKPRLRSQPPAQRYSLAMHAGHLIRLIEHLGLERLALAGNSLGGGLALYLWCTQPQLRPVITGLALLDPACYPQPLPGYVRQVAGWPGALLDQRPLQWLSHRLGLTRWLVDQTLRRCFADPQKIPPGAADQIVARLREPGVSYAYRQAARNLLPADTEALLRGYREVSCPVLALWGQEDQVVPAALAGRLQADIPHAAVQVVPGCGHAPQLECPELVAGALAAWIPRGV
ncbi:MAG: alpha/beta fold hydrolase [Candidatus Latescibacteria bacterium]|nr:alpha/beta fold hydrolase [Candidatus Latescibacterota bacterium]